MISRLKNEVVKTCGFDVKHRGQCELLSKLILERTDQFISYNTLRRLWGLAPGGEPHPKTLDVLAQFCGYASYTQYNNVAPKLAFWHQQAELHRLLASSEAKDLLEFLKSREVELERLQLLLDTTRHLLLCQDHSTLMFLLDADVYTPETYPYAYQIHFASSLGLLIQSLDPTPPDAFLTHPVVVEGVYLRLVDYSALNGYFGHWTAMLRKHPPTLESKIFLQCLGQLQHFLNNQPLPFLDLDELVLKQCPAPLAGRIFTVHLLRQPQMMVADVFDQVVRHFNLSMPITLDFFHEPLMVALMTCHQELTFWLMANIVIKADRLEHFQLHDLHAYRLVASLNALFQGKDDLAASWFDTVDPKEFLEPACQDILVFPYRRIQAQIEGSQAIFPHDVRIITSRLGHAYFSEETWHRWFSDPNTSGPQGPEG